MGPSPPPIARIFTGGFTPFANGGVVSQPTFGLIGEGKYNEAVVPLPDGKSIQAHVAGGQPNVTIALYNDFDQALASRHQAIVNFNAGQIVRKGSNLNLAVRRANGN